MKNLFTKGKTIFMGLFVLICAVGNANAAPITSPADPALSGATVINFEGVTPGEYASLVLPGVTINGIGGTMTICTNCGGGGGLYGDVGQSLQNTLGTPSNFDLVFDTPVSAFGLIGGAVNRPWTYTAYDIGNNVLEVLNLNDPCCGGFFHGIATAGIARVNLAYSSFDWVVFDNLHFVPESNNPVPEPSTMLLLGSGLVGLVGYRWKKSSAVSV